MRNQMYMELGKLFNEYGSDKDRNGYTPLYYSLFNHLRTRPLNFLEIGIGTMIPNVLSSMNGWALPGYSPGGSLRAWRDYFLNSNIYGFDVQPDTQFSEERIQTHICDSSDSTAVDYKMKQLAVEMDIILDDGCHIGDYQLATLRNFFPYLKKGGIYIIEDIVPNSKVSSNPEHIRQIVGECPFYFVGLQNNQCVIIKV